MSAANRRFLLLLLAVLTFTTYANGNSIIINIGPCPLVLGGDCPDPNVRFFFFNRNTGRLGVQVDGSDGWANLTAAGFDPSLPSKIIIHGYNSGMDITPLVNIRQAYLSRGGCNVFAVDWVRLGSCYPTAVHNAHFSGRCTAQLVSELLRRGAQDVHLVGFSVGAHVAAFAANSLRPYKLPRITGLDPALPLFVTRNLDQKLDESDAHLVDVLHTNAFVQGKVERCGHVDFYLNGGSDQPGCAEAQDRLNCNHHRAPLYFAESIKEGRDSLGFWGWRCGGFWHYFLGLCPPRGQAVLMGEFINVSERGFVLVRTASSPPFALGRWRFQDADSPSLLLKETAPFRHILGSRAQELTINNFAKHWIYFVVQVINQIIHHHSTGKRS